MTSLTKIKAKNILSDLKEYKEDGFDNEWIEGKLYQRYNSFYSIFEIRKMIELWKG